MNSARQTLLVDRKDELAAKTVAKAVVATTASLVTAGALWVGSTAVADIEAARVAGDDRSTLALAWDAATSYPPGTSPASKLKWLMIPSCRGRREMQ